MQSKASKINEKKITDLKEKLAQRDRELEIEAALEKVRGRSLAMHKSKELQQVVNAVFEQLKLLDIDMNVASVFIFEKGSKDWQQWVASSDTKYSTYFHIPYIDNIIFRDLEDARRRRKHFYSVRYSFKEKNKWFRYAFKNTEYRRIPAKRKKFLLESPYYQVSFALAKNTGLQIAKYSGDDFSKNDNEILKRFGKVFEQAYTRFLDLQKAEAQAREAQIEAALERVRASSMAMHRSSELQGVVNTVIDRLKDLEIELDTANILIFNSAGIEYWTASSSTGTQIKSGWVVPYGPFGYFRHLKAAHAKGDDVFHETFSKKEKNKMFTWLFENSDFKYLPSERKKFILKSESSTFLAAIVEDIAIQVISYSRLSFSQGEIEILKRFAQVFHQAYTRFLDLQRAEAQAREAEIQLALERVRARTMAMHHSDELGEVASVLFEQISSLTATPDRFNIGIANEEDKLFDVWVTDQEGHKITKKFVATASGSPVIAGVLRNWKKKESYTVHDLYGKKLENWVRYMGGEVGMPFRKNSVKEHRFLSYIFFSHGFIGVTTHEEPGLETIHLLERFSKVFQQTYVRFLDLQKAEAQAREAVKQASLDRVRGEIASMRTSEDLNRITPVIWRELKALEVPFIRCGVFIVDEENESVGVFLTTPDGKALAVLHLAFDENSLTTNTVGYWRNKQVYKEHWNKEEFINWTKSMMKLGQVQNAETYQGSSQPPESLYLYFVPFKQGMLYVGDISSLNDEKLELVKTLAEAFSIAYARYEDFNKLEAAKKQVDHTLNELQATQKQLVQSEKMASLGELTAGIAHEIQNPLNFVNNFSEVTKELLEEMRAALESGDKEEAEEIATDIIQNLEKINHHGKRADAIVKGMLEHSRTSTGVKEPTDINKLADEYLRLAYHGLRAKDKDFNVEMKTDFDETIGKINIIPQDIGRVLLNLYNNAFYACTERSRSVVNEPGLPAGRQKGGNSISYQPTVWVSTKKEGDHVTITVKDNGGGIPENIKEKIFQPFFTTKPTGQGTGLGLSLSYDIIKAHGGELSVESVPGNTAFTITLPITTGI